MMQGGEDAQDAWARGKRRAFSPRASRAPQGPDTGPTHFSDPCLPLFLRSDVGRLIFFEIGLQCPTSMSDPPSPQNEETADLKKSGENKVEKGSKMSDFNVRFQIGLFILGDVRFRIGGLNKLFS